MAANVALVSVIQQVRDNSNDSDTESSSDDDWYLVKKQKRSLRPRIRNYVQSVVTCYAADEFKSHFRLKRTTFEYILSIISPDLIRTTKGNETIPSEQQFMIALWKMATMDSYRSVCDRFNVGRATAVRAVRRVTRALFRVVPSFISWPSNEQAEIIINKFKECSGFPSTIGVIDGTHIRIDAPKENAADYVNRKGYHSIQLQAVCDHRMIISHCFAGYPGSVHDQRIFRSEVAQYLNNEEKFPFDSHILGDCAYQVHEHFLVPFKDNGHLSGAQKQYNYRLSSARVAIERCFALLKGRMRSLLHCLPMKRVDLMSEYIVACCVIHNICILKNDELVVIPIITDEPIQNCDDDAADQRQVNKGSCKRNIIMNTLQRYH